MLEVSGTPAISAGSAHRRRFRRGRFGQVSLYCLSACVSAVALLPLFMLGYVTFESSWPTIMALILRPRVGELLINTLLLLVLALPITLTLGVALAWLTERSAIAGRRAWSVLAVAPLAIPAFVQSYAWVSLFPALHGLPAGVLLSVIAYFPFVFLPVAAALRRVDPAIEDVAKTLGLTSVHVFFRIVLPQLRLAIGGGALLVALHLLAEFGLYAMIRFDTFTTAIFDQFKTTFNGPASQVLTSILVLMCLPLLVGETRLRGSARYARLGSGAARAQTPIALSLPWHMAALGLCAITMLLSLGVALLTIGSWLWAGGLPVWQSPALGQALQQTLLFAGAGAAVTTLAAFPIAWLSVRKPGRLQRLLEGCNYITSALPGITVALTLVTCTIRFAPSLYQTITTVLVSYLLLFLPRALISLRAGIAQAPVELENMACSLGRSRYQALFLITFRLAAPSAAAGAAMVFLAIANELTATLLLAPSGTRTLATGFWAMTSEIDYAAAAPYALLLVLLSVPMTALLYQQSKRTAGR